MIGFRRNDDKRRVLPVAPGERLLACATGPAGPVGGTRLAAYLPERVPWEQVATADWDAEEELLRVVEVAPWGRPPPVHRVRLPAGRDTERLVRLVRERVQASIVVQRHVPVSGRREARILARRTPAGTSALTWLVEYDEGLDPTDPTVQQVVDQALAVARSDVGE